MNETLSADDVARHLQLHYGIDVVNATPIESVWRVAIADGRTWIARAFPTERPASAVEKDAQLLTDLAAYDFPAERCAAANPVSRLGDRSVLVTDNIDGENGRPDLSPETLAQMGALLGRLQTLPDEICERDRVGGSWHHLSPEGGGRDLDVAKLRALLVGDKNAPLRDALDRVDALTDLPHALIHPDFVTANIIKSATGLIVIDWAGTGIGPRIAPLGTLLSTTESDDARITAIVHEYRRYITLEADEINRLHGAVRAFGTILDCWMAATYPALGAGIVAGLPAKDAQAKRTAEIAVRAFAN